jgi:hypothetical protein
VTAPQFREPGSLGHIGVLDELGCFPGSTCTEIDCKHHVRPGLGGPSCEFVQPEGVGLDAVPGLVVPGLPDRPNPILPAIAGDEVPARVADDADSELSDQGEDICAKAILVGLGMARFV